MEKVRAFLEDTIQVCDDVVFRELDGEAVILNLDTGIYFGLNEAGTRMWSLLQQEESLQRVFEALRAEYDVASEVLQADLLRLVEQMQEKGLIRLSAGAGRNHQAFLS